MKRQKYTQGFEKKDFAKNHYSCFAFLLLCCSFPVVFNSCHYSDTQKTENLTAFAHAYGLVRWFYPSDEVQDIEGQCINRVELGA